jgi:hypothetical protein
MIKERAKSELKRAIQVLEIPANHAADQSSFLRFIKDRYGLSRRELATAAKVRPSIIADILAGKSDYALDRFQIARLVCFIDRMRPSTGFVRRDGGRLIPRDMKYPGGTFQASYRLLRGFQASFK